jgi:hypothetical protein
VRVAVGVAVGVALGQPRPLLRNRFSLMNVQHVGPNRPPVLQMDAGPKKPAWLACLPVGSAGVDTTHVPAGHVPTGSSSTSVEESKNPPPVVSPPIAYNLPRLGSYAKPMSARAMVQAGPVE